ncbi:MAG TPA: methyltransferase domain-containing protein [Bryobacteraceae bacterium]|nr:methyltransferase domain-containing protein [Bryobacteraceae bacterium]
MFSTASRATAAARPDFARVENYYDKCQRWYSWCYSDREGLSIHYGFWEPSTRSRDESLVNQYVELEQTLRPRRGELVLDAGCGVGGASLWLARRTEARFEAVTLSSVQLKLARQFAQRKGLAGCVSFRRMNYFHLDFPDASFDAVFGIESFCYSYPAPMRLFRELHRVLKPGGRLYLSDGMLRRQPRTTEEHTLASDVSHGFKMSGWSTMAEIGEALGNAGFGEIGFKDKSESIGPSVDDIHRRGMLAAPLRHLKPLGLVSRVEVENLLATRAQKRMYTCGLFGYGVFWAHR